MADHWTLQLFFPSLKNVLLLSQSLGLCSVHFPDALGYFRSGQAPTVPWKNSSLLRHAAPLLGVRGTGVLDQRNKTPFPQAHIPGTHKTCTGWAEIA